MLRLARGRLLDSDSLCDIDILNGKIERLTPSDSIATADSDRVIDANGRLITAGLIDVHTQGAGNADVLEGTYNALNQMSRTLARQGTTGFLATTVVQANTNNAHLPAVDDAIRHGLQGALCLGIHLEGPYINVKRKGGIGVINIFDDSVMTLAQVLQLCAGRLAMMTIAPEMEGGLQKAGELVQAGVIAALGHTDASYEAAEKGFAAGITHVTHLFNAMPPLHHRSPGAIAAVLNNKNVTAQIISDGVHLDGHIVDLVYRAIGPERCILITDGLQATGLPDGIYSYDGKQYENKNGTCRYLDGTLIGSTLSMIQIAQRFRSFTGCSLKTAIDCASLYPARVLGLDYCKGSVAVGKDADIVIWNDDFSAHTTIIDGQVFV
jgi:N-acetylglucosamine-6-phosphate deacetylase